MLGSLENGQTSYFLFPYQSGQEDPDCIKCVITSSIHVYFQDHLICSITIPGTRINFAWYGALLEAFDDSESINGSIFYDGQSIFIQFTSQFTISTPDPPKNGASVFNQISKISDSQIVFTTDKSPPLDRPSENVTRFLSKIDMGKKDVNEIPANADFILPALWKNLWIPPIYNVLKIDYIADYIQSSVKSSSDSPEYIPFQNCSPYDQILLLDDLLWYNPQKLASLIPKFIQNLQQNLKNYHSSTMTGIVSTDTHLCPPIWSHFILNYVKYSGDLHYLSNIYKILKEDIEWWEKSRFDSKYGLFYSIGKVISLEQETQYFYSPRFRYRESNQQYVSVDSQIVQKMLLVDVNAQMCEYYQNMGIFGMMLNQHDYSEYFEKAKQLQRAYELLWDPVSQFYFDFDLESEKLNKIKTSAGFWALFGGIACKSHLQPLIDHIMNINEFWTNFPIPHVSLDDFAKIPNPAFNYGVLAQNYWFIVGLRKYNCNDVATQIALKTLRYVTSSFNTTGKIHALYPMPSSQALDDLQDIFPISQKSKASHYYSVLPMHSIFYKGILGAEILDDSINFVPNWGVLNQEISFNFQYRGQKRRGTLSKNEKKMFEISNELFL
ncbi:MAG: MGH1-like glycoside hydrolase domain-containing protein [Promethearchaeota archaeon]